MKDDEYGRLEREFSDLLKKDYYPSVKLLPGALDLIKFAKSNFDKLFISSGVPMKEIKYLAKLNGIADCFDLILGTDDQFPTKFDHFYEIKTKWMPQNVVFVADGLSDMKIAKKSGAIPIGITTNHLKQELIDAGAAAACALSDAISAIRQLDAGLTK